MEPMLTLFPMGGGGNIAPPAENRPLSVEKMQIFKNERSESRFSDPPSPSVRGCPKAYTPLPRRTSDFLISYGMRITTYACICP